MEEVIKLIKKHEAFEKSTAAQEERFQALEKLTTVRLHYKFSALNTILYFSFIYVVVAIAQLLYNLLIVYCSFIIYYVS